VNWVIINGKVVLDGGQMTTADEKAVFAAVCGASEDLFRRMGHRVASNRIDRAPRLA